jgi:hypothetical protein
MSRAIADDPSVFGAAGSFSFSQSKQSDGFATRDQLYPGHAQYCIDLAHNSHGGQVTWEGRDIFKQS